MNVAFGVAMFRPPLTKLPVRLLLRLESSFVQQQSLARLAGKAFSGTSGQLGLSQSIDAICRCHYFLALPQSLAAKIFR